MKEINLFKVAKYLVMAISLVQLILANLHVEALLLLENQICGFVMFTGVIIGLVSLFQAVRSKYNNRSELIVILIFVLITVCALFILAGIYSDALQHQSSLKTPLPVRKALTFTYALGFSYIGSIVLFIVDYFARGHKLNKVKKEDD